MISLWRHLSLFFMLVRFDRSMNSSFVLIRPLIPPVGILSPDTSRSDSYQAFAISFSIFRVPTHLCAFPAHPTITPCLPFILFYYFVNPDPSLSFIGRTAQFTVFARGPFLAFHLSASCPARVLFVVESSSLVSSFLFSVIATILLLCVQTCDSFGPFLASVVPLPLLFPWWRCHIHGASF